MAHIFGQGDIFVTVARAKELKKKGDFRLIGLEVGFLSFLVSVYSCMETINKRVWEKMTDREGEHIPCFGDVLSVADGQAHHIADVTPAYGCSVLLIFIVTKKSTFQRTPTADQVWNTYKYTNMRFNYWVLDSMVNSLSHLVVTCCYCSYRKI